MALRKIQSTRDYSKFERHTSDNRPLDARKHRALRQSMEQYGFIPSFPIIVTRNGNGKLHVKDGQHRLMFAETLGLPVYWVEDETEFDVAKVNKGQKPWHPLDYARKYAAGGNADYQEALDFMERHNIAISAAFGMLSGTAGFSNVRDAFTDGTWEIKDRAWADKVAGIYAPLTRLGHRVSRERLLEACMAVCRVKEFDGGRLLANAERCREKIVAYSTRDAYLDMLESIYNFGRRELVGLKAAALMAMRDRNPAIGARK